MAPKSNAENAQREALFLLASEIQRKAEALTEKARELIEELERDRPAGEPEQRTRTPRGDRT